MLISNWMTKDPISVLPSTPLSKCQKLMKLRGIHRLPVVDDDNKVVGIVSDRDVKSNLPSKATTLSVHELQYLLAEVQTKEFMTPSPVTVRETETVSKAALLMLDGKFGGLPVVDDEGHLIPLAKVRGRKKSLISLVDNMEQSIGSYRDKNEIVLISHADCLEDAQFVGNLVTERFGITNIVYNYINTVIGSHSGPGTVALFFLGDKR